MRLLVVTQSVDVGNPVLGFFHGWIREFAKCAELVTVIALEVGEYKLPQNVRVFSLGKEQHISRLRYTFNFYRFIWRERKKYDTVFVHMNQEYVLLGGLLWKLLGKKIMMWRNHYAGSFLTRLAMVLSDKLFCTSKYSFTAQSKKTVLMPVGIDTELFKKDDHVVKKPNSVLFLARISPSKKLHLIIEALRLLQNENSSFNADFYGSPLAQDVPYLNSLKEKVKEYSLENQISFKPGIPNNETPRVYGAHTVFINTSPSGMYDKTIFEAMACETLVLTSNRNLVGEINDIFLFKEDATDDLAEKLKILLGLNEEVRREYGKMLRTYVIKKHGLEQLASALAYHASRR